MLWPWLQASARTWPLRGGSQSKSCRVAIGNCPTLEWKPFRDLNETIGNHLESIHITVYIFIYLFIYLFMCVCVTFWKPSFRTRLGGPFFFCPGQRCLWVSPSFGSPWHRALFRGAQVGAPLETAGFLLEKIDKEIITSIILSIWYIYIYYIDAYVSIYVDIMYWYIMTKEYHSFNLYKIMFSMAHLQLWYW